VGDLSRKPDSLGTKSKTGEKIEKKLYSPYNRRGQRGIECEKTTPYYISTNKRKEKSTKDTWSGKKPTIYHKEINSMEGYQNSPTIPSTIPSSLCFCTTHACKPIQYAERRIEAASFPSTTTSPNITTPNLYPKFISAPDWLSKWSCFSNPAKPADAPQPLPELFSNYKPIHQLRPQSNIYGQKESIPKTMESFQQTKLNVPRNVPQSPQKATSRRLAQLRKQRLIKKDAFKCNHNNVGAARKNRTEQYCLRNFSFCANPALSKSKNFKLALHANPL
jgi:hypothetical protein